MEDTDTDTRDPVCGEPVNAEVTHCRVRHRDRDYVFCSLKCLLAFAEVPEKYRDAYA